VLSDHPGAFWGVPAFAPDGTAVVGWYEGDSTGSIFIVTRP
jgi:hypothetical protein